jgi:hypothetical protein
MNASLSCRSRRLRVRFVCRSMVQVHADAYWTFRLIRTRTCVEAPTL